MSVEKKEHILYIDLPDLRVFIATGVVLFHKPSHTSPNCPDPNLRTNFNELRSISHWSRVRCDSPSVTGFSICVSKSRAVKEPSIKQITKTQGEKVENKNVTINNCKILSAKVGTEKKI